MARHVINHAKILIYNYQYVLDPKVRSSHFHSHATWMNVFRHGVDGSVSTWGAAENVDSDTFLHMS